MTFAGEATLSKILVVDDELQVAKSLQRLLRQAKFEVAIANDGASALVALDQFSPDLVISDYRMPVMNGAELVREIHRRRPLVVCMLLSGYVGADDTECDCFTKPFDGKQLVASIKQRLADGVGKP
ncbi:MAG TPA: response regulator [Kofleriaceae bacterium]|jgi:DNA-binding response OmpR family regulator